MTYKCLVRRYIWRDTAKTVNGAWIRYDMDLPFAPFVGMEYTNERLYVPITIIAPIQWDAEKEVFLCYTDEDFPNPGGFSFDELLKEYESVGWQITRIAKIPDGMEN